jgi:hypothetical protein
MFQRGIISFVFIAALSSTIAAPGDVDSSFRLRLSKNYHVVSVEEESGGTLLIGGYKEARRTSRPFLVRTTPKGQIVKRFPVESTNSGASVWLVQTRIDGLIMALKGNSVDVFTPDAKLVRSSWLPGGEVFVYPDGSLKCQTFTNIVRSTYTMQFVGWLTFDSEGSIKENSPFANQGGVTKRLHSFRDRSFAAVEWDANKYLHHEHVWYSQWGRSTNEIYGVRAFTPGSNDTMYCGFGFGYIIRYSRGWVRDSSFLHERKDSEPPVKQIVLQPDGKIIYVAAHAPASDPQIYSGPWSLRRLNADGSSDPSFDVGDFFDHAPHHLLLFRDGSLLVWGEFTSYAGEPRPGIVRLKTE